MVEQQVLAVLGAELVLLYTQKALKLRVHGTVLALNLLSVELVDYHEGHEYAENTRVKVVTKIHLPSGDVAIFLIFCRKREANLLLLRLDDNLLRRQGQYTFLCLISGFAIPVELPTSHYDPTPMHIASDISSLLLDISIEDAPSVCIKVILISSDSL